MSNEQIALTILAVMIASLSYLVGYGRGWRDRDQEQRTRMLGEHDD